MSSQRQTIKAVPAALRSLRAIILDDTDGNDALCPRLFAAVPRDPFEAQMAECQQRAGVEPLSVSVPMRIGGTPFSLGSRGR